VFTVHETHDLDQVRDVLDRTYARMRLDSTGEQTYLRISRADVGRVALHHLTFRMRFRVVLAPMELVPVGRMISGVTTHQIGSDTFTSGPGDLFLVSRPDGDLRAEALDHDGELALFPPELFARVADAAPGRSARPIRFTGYRPVSAEAATTWSKTFDYLRDTFAAATLDEDQLAAGLAARLLAAATLSTFPNTAMRDPTIEDRRDAHPATLRRAITFIEDNADRDIAPADIAAAGRVTIRTLQLAFRRHLGETPSAYLRRVRLEHAHRQLLDADPAATTVSRIAMRWGFANHSSFSARYRAAYGLAPSETLRR